MIPFLVAFALLVPVSASAAHLDRINYAPMESIEHGVVGGEEVTSDSRVYKMTVRLEMDFPTSIGTCSGTLIAKDLVVTAAHCVNRSPNFINVYINGGKQQVRALKWLTHPQDDDIFDTHTSANRPVNDIALVRLSRPAYKGALIARLPARQMNIGESLNMVVAGFGRITNDEGSNPLHVLHFGWTNGTMVLAGDGQKTDYQIEMDGIQPCNGDSGGPIFAASSKGMVVMGVNSHVNMTCTAGGRAISVRHHASWLRKAAKQMGSKSTF